MSEPTSGTVPLPTDLQDERLISGAGFRGQIHGAIDRVRSGDLGLLPVIVGLIVISVIFQILSPYFLSSDNLSNLLLESSPDGVLALGIVFVMLTGEIDLSVGSVSGVGSAILAILFVNDRLPLAVGLILAVLGGMAIGFFYGVIYNRVGIPSFVITLAGLLGFLGVQLTLLGPTGSVNIPFNSPIVLFGQSSFVPPGLAYTFAVLAAAVLFLTRFLTARQRRKAGLSTQPTAANSISSVILAVALCFVVWYLDQSRGIGWMFVFFVALVLIANYALTATSWGRAVFAIGGSSEAARRAGINIRSIRMTTFVICSGLAALGGVLEAGRLASASQSSGGGDVNLNAIAAAVIGGTSMFGGRGSAFAALLGILVIEAIASGLTLLDLNSNINYMVTGLVVLLAVGVDALARRSRASHGRA